MRAAGYDLGSSLGFVINLGIGGILVGGRLTDRFGGAGIGAIRFGATAVGVYMLSVHMPLAVTYAVVFLTGLFLFSAQAMIYATVAGPAALRGGLRGSPAGRLGASASGNVRGQVLNLGPGL